MAVVTDCLLMQWLQKAMKLQTFKTKKQKKKQNLLQ